jgi:hypothetical protein
MKHILNKSILSFLLLLAMASCSRQWTDSGEKPEKLPRLKEKVFIEKMDSLHEMRPKYFYSKIKVTYADEDRKVSFKSSVNIVQDSALSTILSYAAIPVFTAYLDTEKITIVNKKDKCYTGKAISEYSELWGIELSFENIQELIFGLPIGYINGDKYHVLNNPYEYVISTHKKREQKKSEKRHKSNLIYTYKLNSKANSLSSAQIYSPVDSFKIDINYAEWQEKEGRLYPKEMIVFLSGPKTSAEIKMVFNKLKINTPRKLSLIIPESYDPCN